jgi:hypothetical protein
LSNAYLKSQGLYGLEWLGSNQDNRLFEFDQIIRLPQENARARGSGVDLLVDHLPGVLRASRYTLAVFNLFNV